MARRITNGEFLAHIRERFEGDYTLRFHLAPQIIAERDPETGHLRKAAFGPWMLKAFAGLAKLKRLRGTPFDPFGYSAERRRERRLITEYEATVEQLLAGLTPANHALAVEISAVPEHIRGFGHVKSRHLEPAKAREAELLAAFLSPEAAPSASAAAE